MSLINDALKRAKKAQKENPPPTPALQFRPVEPAQEGHPHSPLPIVAAILGLIVIVALGGLLIWFVTQSGDGGLQAGARPSVQAAATAPAAPVDAPLAPLSVESAANPGEAQTNATPAAVAEPPKAPELKLQGIFFNPRSPSAVVNGRTVYAGEKVSGFRVLKITPETVTLGNATETNVLSLSD